MNWAIRRTTTQALNTTTTTPQKSTTRTATEPTSGFSLVELLVVVAILAILAAIAIPLFLNQRSKAAQGAVQSDSRNLATNMNTMFTNLPRSADPNVALNGSTAPNATLSGSGTISVGGETLNVNLSPDVTITKTGNADPADGAGLKITHAGVDNWACVIPLPFSVAYAQTMTFQQTCGAVVSEVGNLLSMNVATTGDLLGTTSGFYCNYNSSCEVSSNYSYSGGTSFKVTYSKQPDTSSNYGQVGNSTFITSVDAGGTHTHVVRVYSPEGSQPFTLSIYQTDPANISLHKTIQPGEWTQMVLTHTFPTGTAHNVWKLTFQGMAEGQYFYIDNAGSWSGDSSQWAPPGVPIVKPSS